MKENHHYIMKITGDDEEGKRELDNFIDPEQKYPVIATTSKLMTTGVDAQTCKVIVLDSNIQSMTEFKQIIGRGTRIREDFGKVFFTILDFRNVTRLFADPDFDGIPEKVYEPKPGDPIVPEDEEGSSDETEDGEILFDPHQIISDQIGPRRPKIYVDGVEAIIVNERVQYIGSDGRLITESLKDFSKKNLRKQFRSMDDFISKWNQAEKKIELIDECYKEGILIHELQQQVNPLIDIFDLVCHVAFDKPPLTRKERANSVKKRNYFVKYGEQARFVLEALLEKYSEKGIESMESNKVLELDPLRDYGTPREIVNYFGGTREYKKAVKELENEIYKTA
jgi:type I restriction enzyme R subunit